MLKPNVDMLVPTMLLGAKRDILASLPLKDLLRIQITGTSIPLTTGLISRMSLASRTCWNFLNWLWPLPSSLDVNFVLFYWSGTLS